MKGEKKRFVCGFAFFVGAVNVRQPSVLLIRKLKPDWQKGKLNGIGGKVEEHEQFRDAMIREGIEEANLRDVVWYPVTTLSYPEADVSFFGTILVPGYPHVKQMEAEEIDFYPVNNLPWREDLIPNLRFLIPMTFHSLFHERLEPSLLTVYGLTSSVSHAAEITGAFSAPYTPEPQPVDPYASVAKQINDLKRSGG